MRNSPSHDAVLTPPERFMVFFLWIALSGLPVLTMWVLTGYFGLFYSPMMWLFTAGVTLPVMGRVLGRVDPFAALPPEPQPLPHLPPELARMVHEAAAIRDELAVEGLGVALERAWILTCEFDQLPSELRAHRERSLAALAPVRALIDLRAHPGRTRLKRSHQRERLLAALHEFEASLAAPTHFGFR
jgi:hypothetical protein